jgi:soluble P-type ATPase
MLELDIPGFGNLHIKHLVCDYNGTLAVDGRLLPGVNKGLNAVARQVAIHVVTADTFGLARQALEGVECSLDILPPGNQAAAKKRFVQQLGPEQTIALGNGRNDRLMLETAAIGIVVLLEEGAACQTISHADILVPGILPALAFFTEPRRLIATLRS